MSQSSVVEGILDRLRATAAVSSSVPVGDETQELRSEITIAEEGSRQTGQLNPRNPGVVNDAIQFSKKVMRRSLSWYTRPLHLFEGAVIRALQHVDNILSNHRKLLHRHAEALKLHADVMERNKTWLAEQIQGQKAASERELRQLREQVEATFATQESRIAAQESGSAAIVESQLLPLQSAIQELQAAFQRASEQASRSTTEQAQSDAKREEDIQRLRAEGRQAGMHIDALKVNFNLLQARVEELTKQVHQASVQLRVRERDLRRLRAAVPQALQPTATRSAPVPPMFPSEIKGEAEFDYFAFEEQYRGDEADIRQRQQAYVEYFRGRDNVVDIGCGRGEFLDALRDAGITARGVEMGTDQILLCQEKELAVVQQDLFTFLEGTPDESLGGIFSAQVIEHLTASDQLRYVALAYQKCKSGSPVVFETINPQCVYALVRNFFLDPTHVRPVHPETLQFAMESCNFRNVELRFSAPLRDLQVPRLMVEGNPQALEQFNEAIARLNDLLYGFQDYAAIGWK
jgi:2-polyprenyl-3-methyl-5-hydroxy-6-metoxy-1,4-benzoquinol methylase